MPIHNLKRTDVRGVALALTAAVLLIPFAMLRMAKPPLNAAVRRLPFPNDTAAHIDANIAKIQVDIRRYGIRDPNLSDAYYQLGDEQYNCGKYADAVASFDRSLQLPEPKWGMPGFLHQAALQMKFETLDLAHRYADAIALLDDIRHHRPLYHGLSIGDAVRWREQLANELHEQQNEQAFAHQLMEIRREAAQAVGMSQWTQNIGNGFGVRLLGYFVENGGAATAYTLDGKRLSRHLYFRVYDRSFEIATTDGMQITGLGKVNTVDFVIQIAHPADQPVAVAYGAFPRGAVPSKWSGCTFGESAPQSNNSVISDENIINVRTGGLRIVRVSLPAQAQAFRLMIGVAKAPKNPQNPQRIPSIGQLPDHPGADYQWADFSDIPSPLPPDKAPVMERAMLTRIVNSY